VLALALFAAPLILTIFAIVFGAIEVTALVDSGLEGHPYPPPSVDAM
jgi:hypothetical protein